MEAELNSPIVRLEPGGSYAMDTKWYPTRVGESVATVTDAGAISEPLIVSPAKDGFRIYASFGVFFAGKLAAHLYDCNDQRTESRYSANCQPCGICSLEPGNQNPVANRSRFDSLS